MKPYLQVLADRERSAAATAHNTVHRSSLIVPIVEGFTSTISFLNHFYIKRNYTEVSAKITPYFQSGEPGQSVTYKINKPIVYSFELNASLTDYSETVSSYEIEFFCAENLFVPFPAVIINHESDYCINSVHSYNRNLNDLREQNKISNISVKEASFEYINNDTESTFIVFQKGISPDLDDNNNITLELYKSKNLKPVWKHFYSTKHIPSATCCMIDLASVYPDIPKSNSKIEYHLKVKQPRQFMFYGRMMAGIKTKDSKSFSANHSYYDNSEYQEYFTTNRSYRTYPYNCNGRNQIIIHPIMSNTIGIINVLLNYSEEDSLLSKCAQTINYRANNNITYIDIDSLIKNLGLTTVSSFSLEYVSNDGYKPPTRFSHQLLYGCKSHQGLMSSINVTLNNDDVPASKQKISRSWIQIINDPNYVSFTALCFNKIPNLQDKALPHKICLKFFDSTGLFETINTYLAIGDSLTIKLDSEKSSDKYVWVMAESPSNEKFSLYTCHSNKVSGHSSGEHGF